MVNLSNEEEWTEAAHLTKEVLKIKQKECSFNFEENIEVFKKQATEIFDNISKAFQEDFLPQIVNSYNDLKERISNEDIYKNIFEKKQIFAPLVGTQKDAEKDCTIVEGISEEKDIKQNFFNFGKEKEEIKKEEIKEEIKKEEIKVTKEEKFNLDIINDMGWTNFEENVKLLRKYDNSVIEVVNFYLNSQ